MESGVSFWEVLILEYSKKITGPVGAGAHLTGDQEMGMEAEGYGGVMGNAGPLRHKPSENCFLRETKRWPMVWGKDGGQGNL